ncbi:hypothetical protein VNO80_14923 [Phaseolus coccineus]|uniref:Uncharacterized protein n=1 Tax=Phaseolus coccineus TaxID=3886 RepID=A0AAN9MP15_PHACN
MSPRVRQRFNVTMRSCGAPRFNFSDKHKILNIFLLPLPILPCASASHHSQPFSVKRSFIASFTVTHFHSLGYENQIKTDANALLFLLFRFLLSLTCKFLD